MPKFSSKQTRPNVTAPVRTTGERAPTYEGQPGHVRDAKSELFLLAVSNMVSEKTFYEGARERDERFKGLVGLVAGEDPGWLLRFVPFLRDTMQMRSAATVLAAHAVAAGASGSRRIVDAALQRADEPAEILAFYAQEYGKRFPKPLKRGVADAVRRLYNERAALRYDGTSRAWRMGDVIDLVHPKPVADWQSDLFKWLLDTRHGRGGEIPAPLSILMARDYLESWPVEERRQVNAEQLRAAGMSWEAFSGWVQGPMDAAAWEMMIPSMGYMALLRNLRNFEEAGVASDVLQDVADVLTDPVRVKTSRQLPFRFYSAWKQIPSERFGWTLERALELSLENVPALKGRTLVLVDVSGSMRSPISKRSSVNWWEVAALFGAALGKRAESANVWAYSNAVAEADLRHSPLRIIEAMENWQYAFGGTNTFQSLQMVYDGQDRVVIVTDEQAHPYYGADPFQGIHVPVYTFNVVGYRVAQHAQGEKGRYAFGGLSDASFRMLPLLEAQRDGSWPF